MSLRHEPCDLQGDLPVRPKCLPYGQQAVDEEDIAAVVSVLRSDWLTQGPVVAAFEEALAEYCGARYAVAVSSGTAALHLACLAAGVGPRDVGLTSPITFVASANCVAYCGGKPTFVDVEPTTITMDPSALEAACERHRPKVIVPVDFAGQPADLPTIYSIARRYGALVIEDAAHSLGANYQHEGHDFRTGSCAHADMAVFSFHPVKHITTGEGGAVLTNDQSLYQRLQALRSHGITPNGARLAGDKETWYYEQPELGFNYRITDLQCALGLSQLRKLSAFVGRRRELVQRYRDLMADLAGEVTLLTETPGRRSSYHLLVAQLRGGAHRRRHVFERLHAEGIRAQVHYIPVHLQPWYWHQFGYREGDFPKAEAYYAGCMSLPLFPRMSDTDVKRVVAALHVALAGPA
jgi:UDP-4-amino-4,6-dideoxy-N-acetyl-beta-L-altrosamine transaminase